MKMEELQKVKFEFELENTTEKELTATLFFWNKYASPPTAEHLGIPEGISIKMLNSDYTHKRLAQRVCGEPIKIEDIIIQELPEWQDWGLDPQGWKKAKASEWDVNGVIRSIEYPQHVSFKELEVKDVKFISGNFAFELTILPKKKLSVIFTGHKAKSELTVIPIHNETHTS